MVGEHRECERWEEHHDQECEWWGSIGSVTSGRDIRSVTSGRDIRSVRDGRRRRGKMGGMQQ